jgi:hypothetical protein
VSNAAIGSYHVRFEGRDLAPLVLWLGEDWIGGHDGGENRLWRIGNAESEKIRELLGITRQDRPLSQGSQAELMKQNQ